ncbi:10176_t:CDS:2, partial [Cetraspora pellucida]
MFASNPVIDFENQGQVSSFVDNVNEYEGYTNIACISTDDNTNINETALEVNETTLKVNETTLKVNDPFNNWKDVDIVVNKYAKQKGFVAIKYHKDLDAIDKTIVRWHVYKCWKAGVHNPKKVEDISLHRDSTTVKTNCQWQASFNFGKHMTTIHLTSIIDDHNHLCDLKTIELAPKNLKFPPIILDKIKHYTTNGHLNAGQQYKLLFTDFLHTLEATDNLLPTVLFTDGNPAMLAAVQLVYSQTCHLLYIYHVTENVKKKVKSKLNRDMIKNFIGDFYHMCNSYNQSQFEFEYKKIIAKYEPCRNYLKKKLYPSHESWARYSITKIFTAGVEFTQRVESINSVLKKHLDQGTLLKELVRVVENELDKEAQYSYLNNYYGSNPSTGLPSTYNTIFKNINSVLKEHLAKEPKNDSDSVIEHLYDMSQVRLEELLSNINNNEVQEIWEINHIVAASNPHYVVILFDSTMLCTSVFHMGFIHSCWFESAPSEVSSYITIFQGVKSYTTESLHYIDQIRTRNVYTSTIRKKVDKKIEFGTTMSVAKTSVQVAVAEGVTSKLIELFTQFIMKHCRNTELNIEETCQLKVGISGSSVLKTNEHPLDNDISNLPEITNPEYHKPRGCPPKHLKPSTEKNNNQYIASSSKT